MGQQHNTHIVNKSGDEIYIVLKMPGGESSEFLKPDEVKSFPTDHGNVTVSVYEKGKDDKFFAVATVSRSDNSDRSMIIKKNGERISIIPSKYGNIHEEESGIR